MEEEYLYIEKTNKEIISNQYSKIQTKDYPCFVRYKSTDCFKLIKQENNKCYYEAGRLDFSDNFHSTPYTFNNIQILKFTIDDDKTSYSYDKKINLTINVFDLENKKNTKLDLNYETNIYIKHHSIFTKISLLNEFLLSGRPLENLNKDKFLGKLSFNDLYDVINNLDIEFNAVSSGRRFWTEAIITRLPHNVYLKDIIKTIFTKNSSFNFCKERRFSSISNDIITLIFDYDSDMPTYSNETEKREMKEMDLKIRDILKREIPKVYNPLEHLLIEISI